MLLAKMKLIIKIGIFLFLGVTFCFAESRIIVDPRKGAEKINPLIFGNNALGYAGQKASDYGYGLWDPKWKSPVESAIVLLKEANVTVLRFPGGCGTHLYDWQRTVGEKRQEFLFGMQEFCVLCRENKIEPVITLSYFTGDEKVDSALVKRLSMWAVKYYEIGNEVYHGDHKDIKNVAGEEYAKKYLKYYRALKDMDGSLQVGVILYDKNWNEKVMLLVQDKIDFGIMHFYPTPIWGEKVSEISPHDIYAITLAKPLLEVEYSIQEGLRLMKRYAGRDIPIAVTEYNGGFEQDKPVPYRHCLGTALVNAELLRIFMKPENNILMANYWQFCNSYWGMIANGFDGTYKSLYYPYYKRPNYYVFELYAKHFGEIFLDVDVKCDSYDVSAYQSLKTFVKRLKTGTLVKNNLLAKSWEIGKSEGVAAQEKDGILEINFIQPKEFNYYHTVKRAKVESGAYYKLSGYIRTANLTDDKGVCLEVQDARGWAATHSADSTDKVTGTTDWQYVETIYATLPDTNVVKVFARRAGENGPLKGKAYFKDVKLEKFIPSLDTKIPYLSVNASKSEDGKKVYFMVVNKNMDMPMTAKIELKDFTPTAKGNAWVLNGPSVDATNENRHDNVKVVHQEFEIKGNPFEFTFEPHSLTAIEIVRAQGTSAQEHK